MLSTSGICYVPRFAGKPQQYELVQLMYVHYTEKPWARNALQGGQNCHLYAD